MVPFQVSENSRGKFSISWESLFWFTVVTAAGTVIGTYVYNKYVQPYLDALGTAPAATPVLTQQKTVAGTTTFIPKNTTTVQ